MKTRLIDAAVLLLMVVVATAQAAPLSNGGFESGGDPPLDWQVDGTVSVVPGYYGNHMVRLEEPASGGLSRIYQVFDIPDAAGNLVFTTPATPSGLVVGYGTLTQGSRGLAPAPTLGSFRNTFGVHRTGMPMAPLI